MELAPSLGFHKRYWYDLSHNDNLRDVYYDKYLLVSEKLEEAIKRHEVIGDRRVADFFNIV